MQGISRRSKSQSQAKEMLLNTHRGFSSICEVMLDFTSLESKAEHTSARKRLLFFSFSAHSFLPNNLLPWKQAEEKHVYLVSIRKLYKSFFSLLQRKGWEIKGVQYVVPETGMFYLEHS